MLLRALSPLDAYSALQTSPLATKAAFSRDRGAGDKRERVAVRFAERGEPIGPGRGRRRLR